MLFNFIFSVNESKIPATKLDNEPCNPRAIAIPQVPKAANIKEVLNPKNRKTI